MVEAHQAQALLLNWAQLDAEQMAREAEVPVLAIVGLGDSEARAEARRYGTVLTEPLSATTLRRALANSLGLDEVSGTLSPPPPALNGGRALIVEDNPVNQRVTQMMMERLGFVTDLVANGAEAVDAVTRVRYDLVLMDGRMPVMDGYEAAAAIRARPESAGLKIVAVTANAMPEDVERAREAGMDAHLAKPVTLEALGETLARLDC